MSNKFKQVVGNEYIFSILTKCTTLGLSLIRSSLIARFLGPELNGISAYIASIVAIGDVIVTFGMHQAYPYFKKKYGKDTIFQDYMSIIMCIYPIYAILSVFACITLLNTFEFIVAALLIPISGYANVIEYICLIENPNHRNKVWTIIDIVDIVLLLLLFVFATGTKMWVFFLLLVVPVMKAVAYTIYFRLVPKFHRGLKSLWIELIKFGFFPMLALLMTTLNYKIDVFMLKNYEYITEAQLGIYSVGITVADKIVIIADTLKGVMVSKLSKGKDAHEVARVSRICFWTGIFLWGVLAIIGEFGIQLLYGVEYNGAYEVVMISAIGTVFIGYFKLIAQYNIINRKQIRNVIMLSISIILNIIGNSILIPVWGIKGAALSSCIAHLVCGIVFVLFFCRTCKIKLSEMFFITKADLNFLRKF